MRQQKRICVKNKETGVIARVDETTAMKAVQLGTHIYSSKSAFKHYLNNLIKKVNKENFKPHYDTVGKLHDSYNRRKLAKASTADVSNKKKSKGYNFNMLPINKENKDNPSLKKVVSRY